MLLLLASSCPAVLLALLLVMERVERPLSRDAPVPRPQADQERAGR